MNLRDFTRLKSTVESLQSEADRLEGAKRQQLKSLKDEHSCRTVEEAQALLAKLEKEKDKLEREAERAAGKFEKEYGERIER
jgi:hypothetical protein